MCLRKTGKSETFKEGKEETSDESGDYYPILAKISFMKEFPLGIIYIAPLECLKHDLIFNNSMCSKSLRNPLVT